MAYFVEFTSGDYSECIAELQDKSDAIAVGAEKQKEYEAAGKHGIITCYEMSTERGFPMRKCFEFFDVCMRRNIEDEGFTCNKKSSSLEEEQSAHCEKMIRQ